MNPLQFYCNYFGHDQSVILGVCLDKGCSQNRGYCVYCQTENHSSHFKQLTPFREFSEFIQQKIEICQIINEQIMELHNFVNTFLEFSKAINIGEFQMENLNQQQLKEIVDKSFYIEEFQNQLLYEVCNLNETLKQNVKILKDILGKKQSSQQNEIIQQIEILDNQDDKSFRFAGHKLKISGAELKEGNKILCTSNQSCVVEILPEINKNHPQKIQIYFQSGSESYFGIVSNLAFEMSNISFDKKTAVNLNAYLINQEGQYITPTPTIFNIGILFQYQFKSFKIKCDQKLIMEINQKTRTLIWKNLNTNDETRITINKNAQYYFCAGGKNTTLQIIDSS